MAKLTDEVKEMLKQKIAYMKMIAMEMQITSKTAKNYPITDGEIRDLVKLFYQFQSERIAVGNEAYAEVKLAYENGQEANPLLLLRIQGILEGLENDIAKFLEVYAKNHPVGQWMMSHKGVGPIYAAGLLAYIDIDRCQTAGSIWKYAGITGNPEIDRRHRGQKLSYDPGFKVLCWKMGENFMKVSNKDDAVYGKLYREKLAYYKEKNERGEFAERAKQILHEKNFKDKKSPTYKAYVQGKLPDGHMVAMAKRFAVKIFLSHLFDVWFEYRHGLKPPKPFVEAHLNHVHILPPPNKEMLIPNTVGIAIPYTIITNSGEERVIRSELTDFDELLIRVQRYLDNTNYREEPSKLKMLINNNTGEVVFEDKSISDTDLNTSDNNSQDKKTIKSIKTKSSDSNEHVTEVKPDTSNSEPSIKFEKIGYGVTFMDESVDKFKTGKDPVAYAKIKYKDKKDQIVKITNLITNDIVFSEGVYPNET